MAKKREIRAIQLLAKGNNVQPVDQSKFLVRSQSSPNKWYEVKWQRKQWICNCIDFAKRNKKCKHIYAVNYYLMLRELTVGIRNLDFGPICPKCNCCDSIVKSGFRYNRSGSVQRYYCKRCRKWFTNRVGFERMKNQAVAIVSALDLYFRGLSLRQVAEHLESLFDIKVSFGTVYNWIRKYIEIIYSYVKNLKARTSERWHADDTLIRVQGRQLVLWSLLDSETRFLIAIHISERKRPEDASVIFRKGLESSRNNPIEVITDGLPSYNKAIDKEFFPISQNRNLKPIHIQGPLVGLVNNNKIERFYGTLKGRTKNMYHFNNKKGAQKFSEGFYIYYDFVRRHMGLDNLTPAQAAGIFSRKCNWIDLILKASTTSVVK